MTKEEKQLLLIDLCTRLPHGVICDRLGHPKMLLSVSPYKVYCLEFDNGEYMPSEYKVEDIKPYLRPLSSMTEDEFKMVCSMNALTDTELRDRINFPNMFVKSYTIETFDLFNSRHLDYRGLIPMGLALEAKEGMYKTE